MIHDAAGHFIQSVFICLIYSKNIDLIAFIPAVIASLIDIDHFYAAGSFSIKSGFSKPLRSGPVPDGPGIPENCLIVFLATKLQKQAPLHNMVLPLGILALFFSTKR